MLVNGSTMVCFSLNNGELLLNLVGLVEGCCLLFLTQIADPQSKQSYWPGLYPSLVLAWACLLKKQVLQLGSSTCL